MHLNRLANLADRHQAAVAFAIASCFLFVLHRSYGLTHFHFDSGEYWKLATIDNLLNIKSGRGYAYPLMLAPLKFFCSVLPNPDVVYAAGMSIIYGFLLTIVLPHGFQHAFGGKLSLLRRLVPVCLLAILFPGLLLYPLTDLPAVLLAVSALQCTMLALEAAQEHSRRRTAVLLVAAGILMGAAYNVRTIYLFSLGALAVLILVTSRQAGTQAVLSRWSRIAAFSVGVVAVSLPQLAVNLQTHGVTSIAVQSAIDDKSLFAAQLAWGLTLQRYETTVNPEAGNAQVYYFDRAGARLFDEEVARTNLFSVANYFRVVARHPLDFLGIYTRHVINGLDVRDGLVYTLKPSPLRNKTAFFNFIVLALAAWVTLTVAQRHGQSPSPAFRSAPRAWPISLAMLLLPVAAVVPGAIETRFFLPLHLLAYCVLAMHFEWDQLRRHFRSHWRLLLLALLLGAGTFFAVSLSTMANQRYEWPEIYRHGPRA